MEQDRNRDKDKAIIKSVDKAFYILEILLEYKRPASLKELSADTGLPKSTVHALLATMLKRGVIGQNERGEYVLGHRLFEFGFSIYQSWDDIQLANPVLGRVASQTKSNAILGVASYDALINVGYWATNEAMVGVVPFVGTRNPLHATSQGKVFLAAYDEKKLDHYIKKIGLKRYTGNTLTDVEAFKKEIMIVKEKGFSICTGEYHENNRCISVPVFDKNGNVAFALGILDDIKKIKDEDIKDIVKVLKKEEKALEKIYSTA